MIDQPLSLYIHLPWCLEKCPYCDFNSYQKKDTDNEKTYTDALCLDLIHSAMVAGRRPIHSIFFGGGTPSLFACEHIEKILDHIHKNFLVTPSCEITIEMNPSSFETAKLEQWYKMGINRVSVGAQSFHAPALKAIGRTHDGQQAKDAIQAALSLPFRSVNVDIMYALPEQSIDQAQQDLEMVIDLNPPHISWYELTIEANTYFAKHRPKIPDHDTQFAICEQGLLLLEQAGYDRYEISAYAKTGHTCAHNKNYWNFGDYIGCGAGASSKTMKNDGLWRYQKHRSPALYQSAPTKHVQEQKVSKDEIIFEYMLNKLRLMQPFTIEEVQRLTGCTEVEIQTACTSSIRAGWIKIIENRILLTSLGRLFMNDCQASFLKDNH